GLALDRDGAAELLAEALHDVEAETDAAVRAPIRAVDLAEHVEDVRQVAARDADAGVAHGEGTASALEPAVDRDRALARELDGVADQVLQHDLQLPPIGAERGRRRLAPCERERRGARHGI